jgi:hypothetical protein
MKAMEMTTKRGNDEIWYAREYWNGDSKDGIYQNGDGYHYFELKGTGKITRAIEYYETDDGEEHATEISELVGIHWFEFFGFEEADELLESVPEHEFLYISELMSKN